MPDILFRLVAGEVHVWCVSLDVAADTLARCHATLSADERERCARLRFARDRRRFVAAHGALRQLLGSYLETPATQIGFVRNAFGKPALDSPFVGKLEFNLSHSGEFALVAVAAGIGLGVDLEHIRDNVDYREIARQFFSVAENKQLDGMPQHRYAEAFIACWTRREAYLKALGEGFAVPRDTFSLPPAGAPWLFHEFRPVPGYIAVLAIEGLNWRLLHRVWCEPR